MAQWHLDDIEAALAKRGWRLSAKLPGDSYKISASWQLQRSGDPKELTIDFQGLADMETLPIEQAYAATIRGTKHSLHFGRRGFFGSRARNKWQADLAAFVRATDITDTELTAAVLRRIDLVFPEASRAQAARSLEEYCATSRGDGYSPSTRVLIAALKCSNGTIWSLAQALELARVDWRDLLVAAGFEHDVNAHLKWLADRLA